MPFESCVEDERLIPQDNLTSYTAQEKHSLSSPGSLFWHVLTSDKMYPIQPLDILYWNDCAEMKIVVSFCNISP